MDRWPSAQASTKPRQNWPTRRARRLRRRRRHRHRRLLPRRRHPLDPRPGPARRTFRSDCPSPPISTTTGPTSSCCSMPATVYGDSPTGPSSHPGIEGSFEWRFPLTGDFDAARRSTGWSRSWTTSQGTWFSSADVLLAQRRHGLSPAVRDRDRASALCAEYIRFGLSHRRLRRPRASPARPRRSPRLERGPRPSLTESDGPARPSSVRRATGGRRGRRSARRRRLAPR